MQCDLWNKSNTNISITESVRYGRYPGIVIIGRDLDISVRCLIGMLGYPMSGRGTADRVS